LFSLYFYFVSFVFGSNDAKGKTSHKKKQKFGMVLGRDYAQQKLKIKISFQKYEYSHVTGHHEIFCRSR